MRKEIDLDDLPYESLMILEDTLAIKLEDIQVHLVAKIWDKDI